MLEIVVVLLLMSILAATVIGRSVTTSNLDLTSATDKIRNQIRFAQAQAMKLAYDAYPVWGIKSAGAEYWMFRGINPDLPTNEAKVPGGDYPSTGNRIKEADIRVTLSDFTIYFDGIGKPYTAYTNKSTNTPLANTLSITMTAGAENRTITITPETGMIQ
jgi:type II secretory pathway pseudopilin PulG